MQIICGFSGIGKTHAEQKNRRVLDMESSPYSKDRESNGFPKNYIDALEESIKNNEADYYLLSCHSEVRDELKKRGLKYIIVMPSYQEKNEYLKRYLKRGSSADFIYKMYDRWNDMITSCVEDSAPKIFLNEDEYVSDLLCFKKG